MRRMIFWVLLSFLFVGLFPSIASAAPLQNYNDVCAQQFDNSAHGSEGIISDKGYLACTRGVDAYKMDNPITACDSIANDFGTETGNYTSQQLTDICKQYYKVLEDNNVPKLVVKTGDCSEVLETPYGYEQRSDLKEMCQKAPTGYVLPRVGSTVEVSSNAKTFCSYYDDSDEKRFESKAIYEACTIGYEVGFGQNQICTLDYLLGGPKNNNYTSEKWIKNVANNYKITDTVESARSQNETKYKDNIIAACQDGWTQYKVDYWACNDDKSCQEALRSEKGRVINPGQRPTRSTDNGDTSQDPSKVPPGLVTLNTASTTQQCGSVLTTYFSCGSGDGIENSSFWQVLQILLNILISLIGIAGVGGIVFGAMRYAAARDDPGALNEAKTFLRNVIIGLVIFTVIWAIIEYVIPGGLLK